MKKYTQADIKKFLEPETRFHMSAHVIQTEALEMCRQLVGMLDTKVEINENTEYRKLWHDRIDAIILSKRLKKMTTDIFVKTIEIMSQPNLDLNLKAKFDKGMEEHGIWFEKVDFDAEIENEVLDICNYFIGKYYATDHSSHTPEQEE